MTFDTDWHWQRAGTEEGEAIQGTPIVVTYSGGLSTSLRCTRCGNVARYGLPMTNGMVRVLEFFSKHAACSGGPAIVHPAVALLIADTVRLGCRTDEATEGIRPALIAAATLGLLRGAQLERERVASWSGSGEASAIARGLLGEASS